MSNSNGSERFNLIKYKGEYRLSFTAYEMQHLEKVVREYRRISIRENFKYPAHKTVNKMCQDLSHAITEGLTEYEK